MRDLHTAGYYEGIPIGKKSIQGRFVIPSGIRCASAAAIERVFRMETVGIITTKSISATPRQGYREPLYVKVGDNSYLNAVGLENPGAQVFREQLLQIEIPRNKFLLVSLFGGDAEEFMQAAHTLRDLADGFELNMSCPHAKGYGLQVGSDAALVAQITEMISQRFEQPVFVKLSASIPNVAQTAGLAIQKGAAGITVTNTVGPGIEYLSGKPVLSNLTGGLSGEAIRPLGLKTLRDIREVIGPDPLVIGMGGIFNSAHVESYHTAGADFFGIGSALTNLNTEQMEHYLQELQDSLIQEKAGGTPPAVDNMTYQPCVVEENTILTPTLHKIKLSPWHEYGQGREVAGRFFFLMIPGKGEKPFALYSYDDRTFIVRNVGIFTNELTRLAPGDTLYLRGPYGKGMPDVHSATINFVAGGTGIAPTYEMARKYAASNKIRFFLGGKTAGELFDLERYRAIGEVHAATEDGSAGTKGLVTDLLEMFDFAKEDIFVNIGPRKMIEACCGKEQRVAGERNIWLSIEYHTCCGVGICGKCANESGFLSCVDGPFFRLSELSNKPVPYMPEFQAAGGQGGDNVTQDHGG